MDTKKYEVFAKTVELGSLTRAAEELAARGALVKGRDLVPVYHRLSQAERARLERENQNLNNEGDHTNV